MGKKAQISSSVLAVVILLGFSVLALAARQPFAIVIRTVHDRFKLGDQIEVLIHLTNTSDKDVFLTGACAPKADLNGFRVDVKDAQGKVAPETNVLRWLRGEPVSRPEEPSTWSGPSCGTVPPKQFSNSAFILNRFYDLSQPGKYTIQVQRIDPTSKMTVKSNTITVTIVP
jgi:hypothetical protein